MHKKKQWKITMCPHSPFFWDKYSSICYNRFNNANNFQWLTLTGLVLLQVSHCLFGQGINFTRPFGSLLWIAKWKSLHNSVRITNNWSLWFSSYKCHRRSMATESVDKNIVVHSYWNIKILFENEKYSSKVQNKLFVFYDKTFNIKI
jgi:hypothetical protein